MIARVTLALVLLASPAWGAVTAPTAVALLPGGLQAVGGAKAASATITPSGTDRILVITINFTEATCSSSTIDSVTDDQTQTYTLLTPFKMRDAQAGCGAGTWRGQQAVAYTINPAAVATTVSVTITLNSVGDLTFGGIVYNGAHQTTPVNNLTSLWQDATPATISRTVTSATGNMVSEIVCNGTALPTAGNGQTEQWDGGTDTNTDCASAKTGTVAGAASFADTWNVNTGDSSSITAFNVVASASADAGTSPARTLLGVGQ